MFTEESKSFFNKMSVCETKKKRSINGTLSISTVKHGGGNIQVWGCISIKEVGDIVRMVLLQTKVIVLNISKIIIYSYKFNYF